MKVSSSKVILNQIFQLAKANLKSRYRKTFAGFLWVMMNPIILYGVQSQVFSKFLKLNVPNYYVFLLTGLLPWIFIVQSMEMCTPIFQSSGSLLKAFPAHPLVYLMAQLVDNMVNFLAAFILILIPILTFQPIDITGLILLPIPLFTLLLGVLSFAWITSTAQVFFGDTRYLVSFGLSISFFLTPIFYPIDFVPERFRIFVELNPFYRLIAPFRASIYSLDSEHFLNQMGLAAIYSFSLLFFAIIFWKRKKNELYFYV